MQDETFSGLLRVETLDGKPLKFDPSTQTIVASVSTDEYTLSPTLSLCGKSVKEGKSTMSQPEKSKTVEQNGSCSFYFTGDAVMLNQFLEDWKDELEKAGITISSYHLSIHHNPRG